MILSEQGFQFLVRLEGAHIENDRHTVYLDSAGLPTIAHGHLLTKDELSSGKIWIRGERVKYASGLVNEWALLLFKQDTECFEVAVFKAVSRLSTLQHQFDSFVSLAFNIGQEAFKRSTLVRLFNEMEEDKLVAEQWRRWKYSGGKVDKGLIKRREKEIKLFLTGEYET